MSFVTTKLYSPVEPKPRMVGLVDLGPHDCKWPIGDPCEPGFGFCGAHKSFESPYCEYHAGKAFSASASRGGGWVGKRTGLNNDRLPPRQEDAA